MATQLPAPSRRHELPVDPMGNPSDGNGLMWLIMDGMDLIEG